MSVFYMLSLAWKQRRSVILLGIIMAITAILLSLTQLLSYHLYSELLKLKFLLQNLLQSYSCLQQH